MKEIGKQAARSVEIAGKVAQLQSKRVQLAGEHFRRASRRPGRSTAPRWARSPGPVPGLAGRVALCGRLRPARRPLLDTLRQRGNRFLEHERAGKPPVLHFDHEMVLDGRCLDNPSTTRSCASFRRGHHDRSETPPLRDHRPARRARPRHRRHEGRLPGRRGASRRPPGVLRDLLPGPVPGQTLLDVTEAERQFIAKVRSLHPKSAKPVVIGNCQGGWAAMMVAAASPDDVGPS